MMIKHLLLAAATFSLATAAHGQEPAPSPSLSPNAIVDAAPDEEWVSIPADDLLIMTLAPDANGEPRYVTIQLMPAPFSQGWVQNIRSFARAKWYDGITVNRVQDNYVVQWGDPNYDNPEAEGEAKALPKGLKVMDEGAYVVDADILGDIDSITTRDTAEGEVATYEIGPTPEMKAALVDMERVTNDPNSTEEAHLEAVDALIAATGLALSGVPSESEKIAMISISSTQTPMAPEGWHQRDSYATWVEFWHGWPLANHEVGQWYDENEREIAPPLVPRHEVYGKGHYQEVSESWFWPIHCYGMVGVGRNYSPDTGSGAELYTVIGHAPRHLDRNIALVGRIVEGMEHLSSLPRGSGALGFYTEDEFGKRTPIQSVRVASDLPAADQPAFEYLSTEGETFARYADARANRRDPFFIVPAGGADICNIPVPVRAVESDE